jgi:two-component system response regulator NreC
MSTRILLAEDHGIVREGLRSLLAGCEGMEVVGEAEDGRIAVELARQLKPDVVIMDVTMPNLNGIDATRRIAKQVPGLKVIGLSVHSHMMFVADMLKAGAVGYMLKDSLFDELVDAIQCVQAGGTYLSPKIAGGIVDAFLKALDPEEASPLHTLNSREREVLQLVAEGRTTKQIALELHVSVKAIEATRRKIMEKLDAHSIAELVKIAILGGLTSLES